MGLTLDYSLPILSHYLLGDVRNYSKYRQTFVDLCGFTVQTSWCFCFEIRCFEIWVCLRLVAFGRGGFCAAFHSEVYSPDKSLEIKQNTLIDKIAI